MKKSLTLFACTLLAGVAAVAQPTIGGIVNNASYSKAPLPNSGIAQGSIFAIFGNNMGPASIAYQPSYPLQRSLGNTTVTVTAGGQTFQAIPVYTVGGQVGAVLPSNVPVGPANVTVTYNGQTSASVPITVVDRSFGIFSINQQGNGPGVITYATGSFAPVAATNSAKPGDYVTIWGTGLGAITTDETAAPPQTDVKDTVPVQVWVGSQKATITYAGRAGCCAGLDQIVFVVPQGVSGCNVSVTVQINNSVSNTTTMAIAPNGGTCSDPGGFQQSDINALNNNAEFRLGTVSLSRIALTIAGAPTGFGNFTTDSGSASFEHFTPATAGGAASAFRIPSIGSCVILPKDTGTATGGGSSIGLDAGPQIGVNGPKGQKSLTPITGLKGFYSGSLSGTPDINNPSGTPYLDPGAYTITGPGGTDVGGFTANLTLPSLLTWTNQDAITNVPRASGQTVTWSGGAPGTLVVIFGSSSDASENTQTFYCTAPAEAGTFTVPSAILLQLPVTASSSGEPTGILAVGNATTPVRFTATGIDAGYVTAMALSGKSVNYQ
jgi:uncharacterized protein (TIGR03437 family)